MTYLLNSIVVIIFLFWWYTVVAIYIRYHETGICFLFGEDTVRTKESELKKLKLPKLTSEEGKKTKKRKDVSLKQTHTKDNVKVNINNQKAGKQGIKSDVICDAFLQTVWTVKYGQCLFYPNPKLKITPAVYMLLVLSVLPC